MNIQNMSVSILIKLNKGAVKILKFPIVEHNMNY